MGDTMPMAAGMGRRFPFTYTLRCVWMWYAACSLELHWTPSTVWPPAAVDAGASSGPSSTGTPSAPTGPERVGEALPAGDGAEFPEATSTPTSTPTTTTTTAASTVM